MVVLGGNVIREHVDLVVALDEVQGGEEMRDGDYIGEVVDVGHWVFVWNHGVVEVVKITTRLP